MSPHTVAAYRRDLHRYADYLAELGVTDSSQVSGTDDRQLRGTVAGRHRNARR